MLDPFQSDGFGMAELTRAINILPNQYGRVLMSGLFTRRGINTRSILVEENNGVLNILPTQPVGAPGTTDRPDTRKVRNFSAFHVPHDGELLPQEYQGVRAFGQENQLETAAQKLNEKLQRMRRKHEITWEHMLMGALKGTVLDADGSTLVNLYTELGIVAKVIDFKLGTAGTDVKKKCREVVRHIEKNLRGEVMTGVKALVSEEFFDKLIDHVDVRESYLNWSAAAIASGSLAAGRSELNNGALIRQFPFGGMVFEEYVGEATDKDGNTRRFIAANEGHAYPLGTMESFELLDAPGDFIDTANTIGLPLYARQEPRKHNRGIDIHTQSNPLPMCYRPAILVKVHSSD